MRPRRPAAGGSSPRQPAARTVRGWIRQLEPRSSPGYRPGRQFRNSLATRIRSRSFLYTSPEQSPIGVTFVGFPSDRDRAGGLLLIREQAGSSTPHDADRVALVADQASLALTRAELEEEVRHRSTERQLVARLTQTAVDAQLAGSALRGGCNRPCHYELGCMRRASFSRDLDSLVIEAVEAGSLFRAGLLAVGDRLRLSDWHSLRLAPTLNCPQYRLSLG